jgi:general secretion pathway protein F
MPVFEYKALDSSAKSTTGVIDAETPRDAREKLRARRIYVTEIDQVGGAAQKAVEAQKRADEKEARRKAGRRTKRKGEAEIRITKKPLFSFGQGKRTAEVSQFTRQLATLLKAGIPLVQALNALVDQTQNRSMQTVVRDIREQITTGTDFNEALAAHPLYFNDLYRSMVRAGEASGELDVVLGRVADFLQKQTRLRGKITAAMTYPAIMLFMSLGVVIFLLIFVVPSIVQILEEQKIEKPVPTMIVTGVSNFMVDYWFLVVGGVIGGLLFFRAWKNSINGRLAWDRFLLKAPIIGDVFTKTSVSRFATTLSVLLRSGLPALEGLRIVKDVVDNVALSKVIGQVHDSIIEGTDISTPIKKSGVFPPVVGYMIAVGEQTGELEELLDRVSVAYDEEVDLSVQKMTAMIEPIMIVFMAGTVGTIVASVMLPLMQISSQAR